jgi:amino acid adenylation domain-containing protein
MNSRFVSAGSSSLKIDDDSQVDVITQPFTDDGSLAAFATELTDSHLPVEETRFSPFAKMDCLPNGVAALLFWSRGEHADLHPESDAIVPLPDRIAQLRNESPLATALVAGNRQLTFEELDTKATQFAAHLETLGVKRGDSVALCLDRSFDWIIAALGIMRVGAAYVPLDSAWPDDRLRFAIQDSGATAVVAKTALIDRLRVAARGIDPVRDAATIDAAPATERKPIRPDSLAYLIYTSGSTGVPKGVEITHANLAHLIRWHRDAFRVTPRDRASHLAGLGFDASVWEIWPNLYAGAALCIVEDEVRSSPELIQKWMIRERVTIGFVPTVHAKPMMALEWPTNTPLRLLLTGGDALQQAPPPGLPFAVVNNYGPTECTVVATSAVIEPESVGAPRIGRPIAGTSVYLLDERGQPVPDGVAGEIYIGGNSVARGYRNLAEMTAGVFLPDPFAAVAGARMYRTGDRGVRHQGGQIEFRGRLDRQAKIRGQRVELDEIGARLGLHPSVNFAAAVILTQKGEENQLVAYVLPKDGVSVPTANELQEHLLQSLPEYMIPSIFVRLTEVPISANGKVDMKAFPEPTNSNLLARTAAREPVSPIEEELLAIVQALIENTAITAEDNIFLAGGHSLLGMQLVMRLRNAFGVDVSLRQLFEAPTVEKLALLVETLLIASVDAMSDDEARALLTEYEGNASVHRQYA